MRHVYTAAEPCQDLARKYTAGEWQKSKLFAARDAPEGTAYRSCGRPADEKWRLDIASRLKSPVIVNVDLYRRGPFNRLLRLGRIIRGAVRNQQELVRLQRYFITENAVLGNTDAVQAGADRAQPTHDDCSLQGRYDRG